MNGPDPSHRKRALREHYRSARRTLDPVLRARLDRRIGQHLLSRFSGQAGRILAAFLPFDGEPDLEPALVELRKYGVRIALPVLDDDRATAMDLRIWAENTTLQANRFGIREPRAGESAELDDITCLLMPLVAYDQYGTRLGMGGGFYDRLLSARRRQAPPARVGVAYSLQQAPALPREEWDIPLDHVLNEGGWFAFPL